MQLADLFQARLSALRVAAMKGPSGMSGSDSHDTDLSLLARLQKDPGDEDAWKLFVERYGRLIRYWCRSWNLQDADIEDVTQNVLLDINRSMLLASYRQEGKFRYWLKTIVQRAWYDYRKRCLHVGSTTNHLQIQQLLDNRQARDHLLSELDRESRRELLELAIERVRSRVQVNTFAAWRMMSLEGLSGEETATRLPMKIGAVYVAKSRVDVMLAEEVSRLDPPDVEVIPDE